MYRSAFMEGSRVCDDCLTFILGPCKGVRSDPFGPGVRCNWSASASRGVHSGEVRCKG